MLVLSHYVFNVEFPCNMTYVTSKHLKQNGESVDVLIIIVSS